MNSMETQKTTLATGAKLSPTKPAKKSFISSRSFLPTLCQRLA